MRLTMPAFTLVKTATGEFKSFSMKLEPHMLEEGQEIVFVHPGGERPIGNTQSQLAKFGGNMFLAGARWARGLIDERLGED